LFILFVVIASFIQSQTLTGKVIAVTDGDTIVLLVETQQYKIRLNGIDCPEKKQAFGSQAKQFTSERVYGQSVRAVVKDKDRYGRLVCDIYLPNGEKLNEEIVRNGFAWHYKKYSKDKKLAGLEIQARNNRLGLWSDPNPIPPWEYRVYK